MKAFAFFSLFILVAFSSLVSGKTNSTSLMGNRFLTFNAIIRVNQIEVARDKNVGHDERNLHTLEVVTKFREAIVKGFPGARITWAFSWLALHDTTANYRKIREIVVGYQKKYGDEITFIPGAYFANAYNPIDQVNRDLHDGLARVSELVGNGYRPKSVVAGFLSSKNQEYLATNEGIHVCQGNIWSQYAIDNQDGDGAVSYPFYPSKEHFCKPAQGKGDFVDCVNLDGWTMDFLSARREGFAGGFNSRMGVGPIETLGKYGLETGLKEMMHTTAIHFDKGFELNGFAWVTNCWEVSLPIDVNGLTEWISAIRKRWPDVKFITQGEFGLIWRDHYKSNDFNYRFQEIGSGIGGSDADKEIRWFMNKDFRLATLRSIKSTDQEMVIDFTRYDLPAHEPKEMTRRWSLMGEINQKQTRPQDKPVSLKQLSPEMKQIIKKHYPELFGNN
ncbi:MAG TPA: DUF3863 domain-containing protein [Prolixibacteraceae bacterium]|nr:DUF3863 domain-containing protein [Prolixibacteraceae bacterium]